MLWFRTESDLLHCVGKFNLVRRENNENLLNVEKDRNYWVFPSRVIGGVRKEQTIGFYSVNVLINQSFTNFMEKPENIQYLDFTHTNTGVTPPLLSPSAS